MDPMTTTASASASAETLLRVHGDFFELETHLATYGISHLVSGSRLRWDDLGIAVGLPKGATKSEAGVTIAAAVNKTLSEDSWLLCGTVTKGSGVEKHPSVSPLVSAMRGAMSIDDLKDVYRKRWELDATLTVEESDLMSKFGKPGYWSGTRSDIGGTQLVSNVWNSNTDPLVTNFINPSIELRKKLKVTEFNGQNILDILEQGTEHTFVETEWTSTRSNAVRAILALFGVWAFPVTVRINGTSITAGCEQRRGDYGEMKSRSPASIYLPVFANDVSIHRVRAVLSSSIWLPDSGAQDSVSRGNRNRLIQQGVSHRLRFKSDQLPKSQHYATRVNRGELLEL